MTLPVWRSPELIVQARNILHSFRRVVGRDLLASSGDESVDAQALFDAPFVVLSHGTQADPVLNYGNALALKLWEMPFDRFTATPSRLTAELMLREDRQRLLETAARQGYIDDYSGVRISATGRRFYIKDVVLWNVSDDSGRMLGQAATFDKWAPVNENA
ncbi:MAG: hypothetical protein JWL62_3416 [Hyphomicrobiales bacterium]|nr:hypothetical protein [Hyphomicrobiales bacterium]